MKIKIKSKHIKEFTPLIIVCLMAMIIVSVSGVSITNNSALWLSRSSQILSGENSLLTEQRPFFLIILASGFKLFGKTVQSVSLIIRFFFALEIILIYLLGRVFYSKTVGFLSCSLVLTSYGLNYTASFIDTDAVIPFFVLLFVLFYYIGLIRSSRFFAILAGLSLGLGLLVKESSFFCLGLPLGLIIFAQRGKRRQYLRLGYWFFGTLILFFVFLAILSSLYTDTFRTVFEGPGFYKSISSKVSSYGLTVKYWSHLFTSGFPNAVFKFYKNFLQAVTPLSFFLIVGFFFLLIRAPIIKLKSDLILVMLVISALPVILIAADGGFRLGQTAPVYFILYVALAAFTVSCIHYLVKYVMKFNRKIKKINVFTQLLKNHHNRIYYVLIIFVGLLSVKAQLFTKDSRSTWELWTKSKSSLSIFSKASFKVYGRFTTEQQEAAQWLKKNAIKNSIIMADGYTSEALDFFEVADHQIPLFHPNPGVPVSRGSVPRLYENAHPLFLITYSTFDSGAPRLRKIWPIFEEEITAALKAKKADYLVISGRGLFFHAYFDRAKWASLKLDNNVVRIYAIHLERFEPVVFEDVGVNDSITEHLVWLETNYPDEYLSLNKMIKSMGFTIEKLKNSPLRFPRGEVY